MSRTTRSRQLAELQEQIYRRQCVDGRLRPGSRVLYDPARVALQHACRKPMTCMSWQGNQRALRASCAECGLERVIYVSRRANAVLSLKHISEPTKPD